MKIEKKIIKKEERGWGAAAGLGQTGPGPDPDPDPDTGPDLNPGPCPGPKPGPGHGSGPPGPLPAPQQMVEVLLGSMRPSVGSSDCVTDRRGKLGSFCQIPTPLDV